MTDKSETPNQPKRITEERTELMQWYSDHLKERYNQALKIVNEFQAA